MPAKFHPVPPTLWDRAMRGLSRDAQVVRLYVMTCKSRVSEGLFQLPLGILSFETGLDEDGVVKALAELDERGLVSYDDDAEVVLDRTALKYAPLRNGVDGSGQVKPDKRITGALRLFDGVPDTPLKAEFYRVAEEHSPDLAQALGERFPSAVFGAPCKPLRSPFEEKPLPSPLQGGSRGELSRGEVSSEGTLCAWCSQPAMVGSGGEVQVGPDDLPWCGWCDPG